MTNVVSFPGLGLEFELNRVAVTLFGHPIYWYGVIIALGFLLAVVYCYRKAPQFGIKSDDLIDMLFFAVPAAIIGARLYYVIFYLDLFRNKNGSIDWAKTIRIWDGGLAIYGGITAALITLLIFCKMKKIKFLPFADVGVYGLLIGQLIGRWGNFVNVEAYGGPTTLPWRMGITEWVAATGEWVYLEVHPTFLYESLWNLVGLVLLIILAKNWRKFDGQIFFTYIAWYGFGRGLIEGLRTDSLYFFGTGLRVSQLLGFATCLVAVGCLAYYFLRKKHTPEELYVNRTQKREEDDHDTDGRKGSSGKEEA